MTWSLPHCATVWQVGLLTYPVASVWLRSVTCLIDPEPCARLLVATRHAQPIVSAHRPSHLLFVAWVVLSQDPAGLASHLRFAVGRHVVLARPRLSTGPTRHDWTAVVAAPWIVAQVIQLGCVWPAHADR